jgi:hypothetical protein
VGGAGRAFLQGNSGDLGRLAVRLQGEVQNIGAHRETGRAAVRAVRIEDAIAARHQVQPIGRVAAAGHRQEIIACGQPREQHRVRDQGSLPPAVQGRVVGVIIAGHEGESLVAGIAAVQADAGIQPRADAAGEDLRHERVATRAADLKLVQVHVGGRIRPEGVAAADKVKRIVADGPCRLDPADSGQVAQGVSGVRAVVGPPNGIAFRAADPEPQDKILTLGVERILPKWVAIEVGQDP